KQREQAEGDALELEDEAPDAQAGGVVVVDRRGDRVEAPSGGVPDEREPPDVDLGLAGQVVARRELPAQRVLSRRAGPHFPGQHDEGDESAYQYDEADQEPQGWRSWSMSANLRKSTEMNSPSASAVSRPSTWQVPGVKILRPSTRSTLPSKRKSRCNGVGAR